MSWASLCEKSELVEGEGKYVELDGFRLAVFLKGGKAYVMDDECPHAHASLSAGHVDGGGCAVCPLHGWAFRVENGEMRDSPGVKVGVYPVREKVMGDGRVLVQAELPGF